MNKNRTVFLIALFILVVGLSAAVLLPFFTEIVLSIVLSVILRPLYKYLVSWFGGRKALAAMFTIVASILCIFAPVLFIGAQIFTETQNLYGALQAGGSGDLGSLLDKTSDRLSGLLPGSYLDIRTEVGRSLGSLTSHAADIISGTLQTFLSIFIILVAVFYFLKDGESFRSSLIEASPLDDKSDRELLTNIAASINTIIRGTIFVAIVQAAVATVGFIIFGVPNPLLWGFVSGIAAVVPMLGTGLVVVPAALYLFWTGLIWQPIGLLIWGLLIVGLIDNFLKPYLYGRGFKIHPLVMLFAILGGLAAFGAIGFVLGPIIIALFVSILEMYRAGPKPVA